MTRAPDFRDLIGDDIPAEERDRLHRVHDLLVTAGPPPELPDSLTEPPSPRGTVTFLQRRLRTAIVLAAALALAAFAFGYLVGERDDSPTARFAAADTVILGEKVGPQAIVRIGERDANGNHPMLLTVERLPHAVAGDYYTLFMTRNGRPIVPCGTFNVRDERPTTFRFTVGYDLNRYDGLLLAEYRARSHKDYPLIAAKL